MGSLCFSLRKQVSDKKENEAQANQEAQGNEESEENVRIKVVEKFKGRKARSSTRHQSLAPSKRQFSMISQKTMKHISYVHPDEKLSEFLEKHAKYSINSDPEKILGDFAYEEKQFISVLSKKKRIIISTEAFYMAAPDLSDPIQRVPIQCLKESYMFSESKRLVLRANTINLKPEHYKTDHFNQRSLYIFSGEEHENIALCVSEAFYLKMGIESKISAEGHDRLITKKNSESNKNHLEKYNKFLVDVQKALNDEVFYGVYKVVTNQKSGNKAKRIIVVSIACLYFFQGYSNIVIKNKVLIKSVKRVEIVKSKSKVRLVLQSKSVHFESPRCEELILLIRQINKTLQIKFVVNINIEKAKTFIGTNKLQEKNEDEQDQVNPTRSKHNKKGLKLDLDDVQESPLETQSIQLEMKKENKINSKNKHQEKHQTPDLESHKSRFYNEDKGNPHKSNKNDLVSISANSKNVIVDLKSALELYTSDDDEDGVKKILDGVNSDVSNILEDFKEGDSEEEEDFRSMSTDEILRRVKEKLEILTKNGQKKSVRIMESVNGSEEPRPNISPNIRRKSILKNVSRNNSFNSEASIHLFRENDVIANIDNI